MPAIFSAAASIPAVICAESCATANNAPGIRRRPAAEKHSKKRRRLNESCCSSISVPTHDASQTGSPSPSTQYVYGLQHLIRSAGGLDRHPDSMLRSQRDEGSRDHRMAGHEAELPTLGDRREHEDKLHPGEGLADALA